MSEDIFKSVGAEIDLIMNKDGATIQDVVKN